MIYIAKFIQIATMKNPPAVISISNDPPQWYKDKKLPVCGDLVPEYANDKAAYLDKLYHNNATDIVNRMIRITHKKDIVIVADNDVHLKMVKEWFNANGFVCKDFNREDFENDGISNSEKH